MAPDATCEDCGGSGVEMYVGWENSVNERPCCTCDGTGRAPSPTGQLRDEPSQELGDPDQ
jgi:DnaJ-class molecular chaperone